ncbi:hypothetical protein JTB14_011090 [Gonioctena quinquepunctata]|nr:hypothetical protein JTB14_011090 [Gonioctena quinquepunctata]
MHSKTLLLVVLLSFAMLITVQGTSDLPQGKLSATMKMKQIMKILIIFRKEVPNLNTASRREEGVEVVKLQAREGNVDERPVNFLNLNCILDDM